MSWRPSSLLAWVVFALACSGDRSGGSAPTETIPLWIRGHILTVELCADPESRARGLMFRRTIADNAGMLFVFPSPRPLSFWMRNTFVPLSIAFLDGGGRILNIEAMAPFDEAGHRSAGEAAYALEVPLGWFEQHAIEAGDVAVFKLPSGFWVQ